MGLVESVFGWVGDAIEDAFEGADNYRTYTHLKSPYGPISSTGGDFWGHIPMGMKKPPQHVWSQFYNEGIWSTVNPSDPTANGLTVADPTKPYYFGIANDALFQMGASVVPVGNQTGTNGPDSIGNIFFREWDGTPDPQSMAKAFQDTDATGKANPSNICTPYTYPNCNMTGPRNFGHTVSLWTSPEEPVVLVDRWRGKVDALTTAYANDDFHELKYVNRIDPFEVDNCFNQESTIERVLPVVAAIGVTVLVNIFTDDFMTILSTPNRVALALIPPVGTYLFFKWEFEKGLFGGGDDEANATFEACKIVVVGGGGFLVGGVAAELLEMTQNHQIVAGVAGGAILYYAAGDTIGTVLKATTWVSGLAFQLTSLWGKFSKGVSCEIGKAVNPPKNICIDLDNNPTARRWDAGSIAAMLTDEACKENNWRRDDPQAEFVYRSLLTGTFAGTSIDPNQTTNPITTSVPTEINGMIQGGLGFNPLGEPSPYPVAQVPPTVEDIAQRMLGKYSANFDYMLFGYEDGMPSKDNTCTVNMCQPWESLFDAKNPSPYYPRLRGMLDAAVANSKLPANIAKQNHIFGWNTLDPYYDINTKPGTFDSGSVPDVCEGAYNQIMSNTVGDVGLLVQPPYGVAGALKNAAYAANNYSQTNPGAYGSQCSFVSTLRLNTVALLSNYPYSTFRVNGHLNSKNNSIGAYYTAHVQQTDPYTRYVMMTTLTGADMSALVTRADPDATSVWDPTSWGEWQQSFLSQATMSAIAADLAYVPTAADVAKRDKSQIEAAYQGVLAGSVDQPDEPPGYYSEMAAPILEQAQLEFPGFNFHFSPLNGK